MLELIEGIKIVDYNSKTSRSKQRILVNSGTLLAHKVSLLEDKYSKDAFIPIECWRKPDFREKKNTSFREKK